MTKTIFNIFTALLELKTLKETLLYNISHVGSLLIKQLKRRDLLLCRRETHFGVITAFLQAKSAKRSKIQFLKYTLNKFNTDIVHLTRVLNELFFIYFHC